MNSIFGTFIGNICGGLYYIFFQFIGYFIIRLLFTKERRRVHIIGGSVFGTVMMQWLPVIFAFFVGFNKTSHILALITFAIALVIVFRIKRNEVKEIGFSKIHELLKLFKEKVSSNKLISIFIILLFILFYILCSSHTLLQKSDGSLHTGQCSYGDMSMHLGFITSIARQEHFPPNYSIMAGEKLCYPFLCDSISSSIYIWGSSLRFAYIFPMLFAFVQVMLGFYCFAKEWLMEKAKAILAFFLFFLNGGFGFAYFLNWSNEGGLTITSIFSEYYKTPTNLIDSNIRWVNIIADMLLPQRATLFGYAVLFTAVWLLYMAVFKNKSYFYPIVAILVGSLPMIHTHSFLAIGIISASWLLMMLQKETKLRNKFSKPGAIVLVCFLVIMIALDNLNRAVNISPDRFWGICIIGIGTLVIYGIYSLFVYIKNRGYDSFLKNYSIYIGIVLILALPQLLFWTFNQASNSGFNNGQFNWGNLGDSYIWFYVKNWGIILIMLIPAIMRCTKKNFAIISGAFVIWFVLELIVFTPNPYDNNKLLYIVYMFFTCIAADYAIDLYRTLSRSKIAGVSFFAVLFVILSSASALLTLGREYVSDYQVYSADQINVATYVDNEIEEDAIFLTSDRHLNEITALAGRTIVSGAGLYLGPHGILDYDRENDVRLMFENPSDYDDLFNQYNVDYIVISSWERNKYQLDETFFISRCDKVYESGDIAVYKYE